MKGPFLLKLSHYGDMLAIPFFIWLSIYFIMIEEKTTTEYILLLFSIGGAVLDILFTYIYLSK
jgi:hypothetical protein